MKINYADANATADAGGDIDIREAMLFVKENHTFINRVNTILKFL